MMVRTAPIRVSIVPATVMCLLTILLAITGCSSPQPPAALTSVPEPVTVMASRAFEMDSLACASATLVEASTGAVLYEQQPDLQRAPASLVKMMLELVVMEQVEAGKVSLDDPIRASAHASRMGGSQVYLREGEVFALEELMKSIAIASANDACVAVAEHVAGSTAFFVDLMNRRADRLGLEVTQYINVHGLDDEYGVGNVTTAREIARLGREIIEHPHILDWSSLRREPFRNGTFMLENTNTLIDRFDGMDGIKTGYTERAGYNLCATAEREGLRLVSVVMGAELRETCAEITAGLMNRAFRGVRLVNASRNAEPVQDAAVAVEQSGGEEIRPLAFGDVVVIAPAFEDEEVEVRVSVREPLLAPLLEGSPVGELTVWYGGKRLARVPLVSDRDVPARGMKSKFRGMFGG